ncbi:MAG TPA: hypothetical protein VGA59_00260 [Ramlibacter sp.]
MKLFTLWLPKYSFSLAVMMAFLAIILTPLNQLGLSQYNIEKTLPENKIEFPGRNKNAFNVGDRLPIYRFNPEWEKPIGEVEVLAYDNGKWIAGFNPDTLRWPMGNQGTIVRVDAQNVSLNVGQRVGVKAGDTWNIFDGRDNIGKIVIRTVHEFESVAQLVQPLSNNSTLVGLQVSPYILATQVIVFDNLFIRILQITVLFTAFTLWVWSMFSETPANIWFSLCQVLRDKISAAPTAVRFRFLVIIGVPICYGIGALVWNILCHINWYIHTAWLNQSIEHYPAWGTTWMQILVAAAWYAVLFGMLRSPMSYLVERLRYKPLNFSWFPLGAKPYLIWLLHLFVYYAFTNTLGQYAVANMQVMVNHAWPDFRAAEEPVISSVFLPWMDLFSANYSSSKHLVDRFYELLVHMSTHAPVIADPVIGFLLLRLSMWTLTICVILCLYTYTVICILWTRSAVRNIDFTFAGWVTAAVCYGPLLGDPLHQTIPSAHGLDPTYITDVWMWFVLVVESLLNLLYMLSIFNLGLMFGMLVDKGVRTQGFYAVIRHPNYTLEALMFVVLGLMALSGPLQWIAISVIFIKYWLRSEREDQFMSGSNRDYLTYKTQTPWKFIPGLY